MKIILVFMIFTLGCAYEFPSIESIPIRYGYSIIWGGDTNVNQLEDGMSIQIVLDKNSGSGFKSKERFQYGFFGASIKLPANYSAGVVTAFYVSNADQFPDTHDEIDFEFLGIVPGMPYTLQTNIYGNGSVDTGREERIRLWFDPTVEFHRYSILWTKHHIVFYVDGIPIRQLKKKEVKNKGHYPEKPMSVYATIWDGSNWATSGGKFPVDYSQAPFVAGFTDMRMDSRDHVVNSVNGQSLTGLSWVRRKFMSYSYCRDEKRYPNSLPECRTDKKKKVARLYGQPALSKI